MVPIYISVGISQGSAVFQEVIYGAESVELCFLERV